MKSKFNKIVIGTWGLSGDLGKVKENPIDIFNKAIELGFNEFDTAPTYGKGKIYKIISKIPYKTKEKIKFNTKCGYDNKLKKKNFLNKRYKNIC